jgi:hypothetical protein
MNFRDYVWFKNPRGLHNSGPYISLKIERYTGPRMGWAKLVVGGTEQIEAARILIERECMPIIRMFRERLGAEPAPDEWYSIYRQYYEAGVRWFELYSEPNMDHSWPLGADGRPSVGVDWNNHERCIQPLMDNWLMWAERIIEMGGYPAFPALGETTEPRLATITWMEICLNYLKDTHAERFQKVIRGGLWCATHPDVQNRFYQEPPGGPADAARPYYQQSAEEGGWHFEYPHDLIQQKDDPGRTPLGGTAKSAQGDPNGLIASGQAFQELLRWIFNAGPVPVIGTAGGIRPLLAPNDKPVQPDHRFPPYSHDSHAEASLALFKWIAESAPAWMFGLTLEAEQDYFESKPPAPAVELLLLTPPVTKEVPDLDTGGGVAIEIAPPAEPAAAPAEPEPAGVEMSEAAVVTGAPAPEEELARFASSGDESEFEPTVHEEPQPEEELAVAESEFEPVLHDEPEAAAVEAEPTEFEPVLHDEPEAAAVEAEPTQFEPVIHDEPEAATVEAEPTEFEPVLHDEPEAAAAEAEPTEFEPVTAEEPAESQAQPESVYTPVEVEPVETFDLTPEPEILPFEVIQLEPQSAPQQADAEDEEETWFYEDITEHDLFQVALPEMLEFERTAEESPRPLMAFGQPLESLTGETPEDEDETWFYEDITEHDLFQVALPEMLEFERTDEEVPRPVMQPASFLAPALPGAEDEEENWFYEDITEQDLFQVALPEQVEIERLDGEEAITADAIQQQPMSQTEPEPALEMQSSAPPAPAVQSAPPPAPVQPALEEEVSGPSGMDALDWLFEPEPDTAPIDLPAPAFDPDSDQPEVGYAGQALETLMPELAPDSLETPPAGRWWEGETDEFQGLSLRRRAHAELDAPDHHWLLISHEVDADRLFRGAVRYFSQFTPTVVRDDSLLDFIPQEASVAITVIAPTIRLAEIMVHLQNRRPGAQIDAIASDSLDDLRKLLDHRAATGKRFGA